MLICIGNLRPSLIRSDTGALAYLELEGKTVLVSVDRATVAEVCLPLFEGKTITVRGERTFPNTSGRVGLGNRNPPSRHSPISFVFEVVRSLDGTQWVLISLELGTLV